MEKFSTKDFDAMCGPDGDRCTSHWTLKLKWKINGLKWKIERFYSIILQPYRWVRLWWIFDVLKKDKYEFEAWTINPPSEPTKPGERRVLKASYGMQWHRFNLTLEECEKLYKYHIGQGNGAKFYLDPTKELVGILSSEIQKEINRELNKVQLDLTND